jgi:Cleaved Adhesin Domain/Secretion system C-terminal sorting domain/Fibronectin type III domain
MKKITLLLLMLLATLNGFSQFIQNFDGGTTIPAGWSVINGGGANTWVFSIPNSGVANSGTNVASITYNTTAHDDYLITPQITVVAGVNDRITYWVRNRSTTFVEHYEVKLSTSTNTANTNFSVTLTPDTAAPSVWTQMTVSLAAYIGQSVYVGFRALSTDQFELYLDDIVNDTVPACDIPSLLTSSAITTTSATISWTAPASAPVNGYEYFLSTTNTAPIATTIPTGSTAAGVVTKSLPGLLANTPYYYWVRSKCSASSTSTWSSGSFTTLPIPPSNDECSTALPVTVNPSLTCTTSTAGTVLGATASAVPNTTCFGNANDDVWFSFVATQTSHAISLTNVSGFTDMYHSLYSGTCSTLTLVPASCRDADTGTETGLTIGSTYYIRVYSYSATPQTATFNVCVGTIPPPPSNDECSTAISITPGATYTSNIINATNGGATTSANPAPATCGGYSGGDVWYKVIVPSSGNITIETGDSSTGATGFDSVITVYSGSCGSLTQIGCDDDGAATGAYSLKAFTGLTAGSTIYVRVYEYNNDSVGNFGVSAYDASLTTNSFNNEGFSYYPNPVVDYLKLSYTQNIDKIEVMNMLGQVVLAKAINANESNFDMSSLAKGTYMVKVAADNQIKTIKVIKE